jgi:sugar phosphate isomerase/epimerase
MPELRTGFTVPLEPDLSRSIEWGADAGFDFVELLLDGPFARDRLGPRRGAVADLLAAAGLDLVVHLPFAVDVGSPFAPVREGAVAELAAGVELADALGAETAVVHPQSRAWGLGWSVDERRGFVRDGLGDLRQRTAGLDPVLAVENAGDTFPIDAFGDLLGTVGLPATFDTGHAALDGFSATEMADFLAAHRDRIRHVHLSDTRGGADEHLPVGMGTIDFETALAPLLDGWSGTATHEVGTEDFDAIALGKRHFDELR